MKSKENTKKFYIMELRRAFCSKGFYAALLIGCIMTAAQAIEKYGIFREIMGLREQYQAAIYMSDSAFNMFFGMDGVHWAHSLFYMLVPLLATIPYGCSYARDKKSGYVKNIFVRGGRKTYFRAKYLAVFLSGGAAVMIPLLFNLFLVTLYAPLQNVDILASYLGIGVSSFYGLYLKHTLLYMLLYILITGMTGGIYATIALTISQVTDYVFTVWAGPLLLSVILYNVCTYLGHLEWVPMFFMSPSQAIPTQIAVVLGELVVIVIVTSVGFCGKEPERDVF